MNLKNQFSKNEVPYGIFEEYGITKHMLEDLPEKVLVDLLNGRPTPLLPVRAVNSEGKTIQTMVRIELYRMEDDTVDIQFILRKEEADLSKFDEQQQMTLKDGKVILMDIPEKGECYVQLDTSSGHVMTAPKEIVMHNITMLARCAELSEEEKDEIAAGDVVEFNRYGQTDSAGIDLGMSTGMRIVKGNVREWKEESKNGFLPKYNFGLYGCWTYNAKDGMTYTEEDNYSNEMILEMARVGKQKAARETTRHLSL